LKAPAYGEVMTKNAGFITAIFILFSNFVFLQQIWLKVEKKTPNGLVQLSTLGPVRSGEKTASLLGLTCPDCSKPY
jgi:hypothetical protein